MRTQIAPLNAGWNPHNAVYHCITVLGAFLLSQIDWSTNQYWRHSATQGGVLSVAATYCPNLTVVTTSSKTLWEFSAQVQLVTIAVPWPSLIANRLGYPRIDCPISLKWRYYLISSRKPENLHRFVCKQCSVSDSPQFCGVPIASPLFSVLLLLAAWRKNFM